ncbi:MAG: hypothetical protein IPK16_02040 [Anaerolineales bacterium]|nr:hypothetical protein [Anaerolineales bacterium]
MLLARIVQHWEINTDWWTSAPAHREYFAAITTSGMLCVVYEDKIRGGWWVEKVYD